MISTGYELFGLECGRDKIGDYSYGLFDGLQNTVCKGRTGSRLYYDGGLGINCCRFGLDGTSGFQLETVNFSLCLNSNDVS